MEQISLEGARRMALHAQLVDGSTRLPPGKEGVAQAVERLGYVQIDTIAVIQRAHHHTLWTRQPDYSPHMLHELQAVDRRVFEYWGHAASYLPMSDYRFYLPRMRSYDDPNHKWIRNQYQEHDRLFDHVLERIQAEGPLGSKDFKPPPGMETGAWWNWKPAKVVLELLFWRGDLMITERRNFQRVYDLTERVLPEDVDTRLPDDGELGAFLVRRAISANGLAQEKEIWEHIHAAERQVISKSLADLVDAGQVVPIRVESQDGIDYYVLPEMLDNISKAAEIPARVLLLSPFDNLVIQRSRIKDLFGFDYSLECYTPAIKRVYGYFSLPILWGERLVGRLDPKADRKSKTLIIRSLHFEPGFNPSDAFWFAFTNHLAEFASFNGCEKIELEQTITVDLSRPLKDYLDKFG